MTRRNVRSHEYDRIIGPCFKSMATIPKRAQATCPGWIVPYTMVKQPIIPKTTWTCKRIRAGGEEPRGAEFTEVVRGHVVEHAPIAGCCLEVMRPERDFPRNPVNGERGGVVQGPRQLNLCDLHICTRAHV